MEKGRISRSKGFTLLEMALVIGFIALLFLILSVRKNSIANCSSDFLVIGQEIMQNMEFLMEQNCTTGLSLPVPVSRWGVMYNYQCLNNGVELVLPVPIGKEVCATQMASSMQGCYFDNVNWVLRCVRVQEFKSDIPGKDWF